MRLCKDISLLIVGLMAVGCGRGADSGNAVPMEVERFDRAEAAYAQITGSQRDSVVDRYEAALGFMSAVSGVQDADSLMMLLSESSAVKVFQPDIETRLGDLSEVERQFGMASRAVADNFSDLKFPSRIIGFVTPYDQSVVMVDSVAMIGLNHYLGSDYPGYAGFDEYRRRLKVPQRMVYDVAEAVVRSRFPYDGGSASTVASRIAYEGAIVKAVETIVDGSDLWSVIAYDEPDRVWAEDNEQALWSGLVSDGRLYSLDQNIAERLVMPAPFSMPFSTAQSRRAPGRIGRFIGYKMVDSYLKRNAEVSVEALLRDRLYNGEGFVVESGYLGS